MALNASARLPCRYTLLVLALALATSACARLERLALPEATLNESTWAQHDPASTAEVDHSTWDRFLGDYVRPDPHGVNRVAYAEVGPGDRAILDAYLDRLYATQTATLTRSEQLAFWVNLYNARTVSLVLEHYPVSSIRHIKFSTFAVGPWSEPLLRVQGRSLSLNDIEHRIVRPIWQDARIHYVLNCAAVGCPNLAKDAYTGDTIDHAMDVAAHAYVNDRRGIHIDEQGRLIASKIYVWFEEDFGASPAAVLTSLRPFAAPELAAELQARRRIDGYAYDWRLNDAAAEVSARRQVLLANGTFRVPPLPLPASGL